MLLEAASASSSGAGGYTPPVPKSAPVNYSRVAPSDAEAIGQRAPTAHELLAEDAARMQDLDATNHKELDPILVISVNDARLDAVVKQADHEVITDFEAFQGAYFGTPIQLHGFPVYKKTPIGSGPASEVLYLWKGDDKGWYVGVYVFQNEKAKAAFIKQSGNEPPVVLWINGDDAVPSGPAHYPYWASKADHDILICGLWEHCLLKDRKMEYQESQISVLEANLAEAQHALEATQAEATQAEATQAEATQAEHDGDSGKGGRSHPYNAQRPKRGGWVEKAAQLGHDVLQENYGAARWRIAKFRDESHTFTDCLGRLERNDGAWTNKW